LRLTHTEGFPVFMRVVAGAAFTLVDNPVDNLKCEQIR